MYRSMKVSGVLEWQAKTLPYSEMTENVFRLFKKTVMSQLNGKQTKTNQIFPQVFVYQSQSGDHAKWCVCDHCGKPFTVNNWLTIDWQHLSAGHAKGSEGQPIRSQNSWSFPWGRGPSLQLESNTIRTQALYMKVHGPLRYKCGLFTQFQAGKPS